MGIEKFLKSISVQTAVYWSISSADGYGSFTYDDPVEVPVRWAQVTKLVTTGKGRDYVSKAEIIINQDMQVQDWLYLGNSADLSDGEKADPKTVNGAHQIVRFDRTLMIGTTDEYIRTAYI